MSSPRMNVIRHFVAMILLFALASILGIVLKVWLANFAYFYSELKIGIEIYSNAISIYKKFHNLL